MDKSIFRRFSTLIVVLTLSAVASMAQVWAPDVLNNGFEYRTVNQAKDYSGEVVSTIIRKLAPDSVANGRAVLYVHGYNDYFFQTEMAQQFIDHGYDFYAVDLRKYGRSIRPGQHMFEVRNLKEYFPDIDSAMVAIENSGVKEVVLMGHSTGGLITSYYMAKTKQPLVKALVLNSPFLDWNLGSLEKYTGIISFVGGIFPKIKIKQGSSTAYAESLLSDYHGEWHYNTNWKLMQSPDVTTGWIHAINSAQRWLRNNPRQVPVPVLLMYSDKSIHGSEWTPDFNQGDAVLDVNDIRRYGLLLSDSVTCLEVDGGLHDLVLSKPAVRAAVYSHLFPWLNRTL